MVALFFLLVIHVWQVLCFFSSCCFNWMFFNHKPNSSIMNHAQAVSLLKKECFGGCCFSLFFIGVDVIAVDIVHGFCAKNTRMATGDDQNHSFKVIIFEICWLVQLFRAFFFGIAARILFVITQRIFFDVVGCRNRYVYVRLAIIWWLSIARYSLGLFLLLEGYSDI